jgi:ribosomal-protein-alanine N-acetyltransferase
MKIYKIEVYLRREIVMMKDIYEECPTYKNRIITLRQTNMEDVQELLKCYSDENAVPFFNSDNCNGDDFHYITIERMKQAIDFWNFSYKNKYFVRWTVILNDTNEKVGTIEMFHRIADDGFNHYGILRIDLQSNYETQPVINDILEIVNENFYKAFDVKAILTKAIPSATERITSLVLKGYQAINEKLVIYDDYFVNKGNK